MNIIRAVSASRSKRYFSVNGSLLLPLALKWRLARIIACSLFTALVLPCLAGGSAFAASITLSVPGRLTLTVAADGAFHESATAATVSVTSDAYSGYTLGVKSGESTSPALKNGSNTIPSISSAMASSAFPANTWGWLPSKLGGQANTQYQPGPTSTLVTIEKTASANASTANSYTIKLGAKVNGTIPAGTYVNTFTFTATANPVPYNISYNTNGGGTVNATTGSAVEGTQITLANAPSRSGYAFLGWCTVSTNNETCPSTGKSYTAGGKYPLTNSANNVTLYAMWALPMQSWGANECAILSSGKTVTLVDTRDNNIYRVRKLADGKCWMIDNLRLGDSKLTNRTLTSGNTDLNGIASYTLPSNSKNGFISGNDNAENIYVVETDSGSELKTYGGYYTWNAATAGTGASITSNYIEAPSSICPTGWKLPASASFTDLNNALGGITDSDTHLINSSGPAFLRAGEYSGGSAVSQGNNGAYWFSTAYSSNALFVRFSSTTVTTYQGNRNTGHSVRCVASTPYSISYNLNGGSGGPSPNPQTGATTLATITLDSKTPTKSGHIFQYWCSANNTSSPTTCSGTHYNAGAAYTLSSGANTTLYAVWQPTMQNWTGCSSLAQGSGYVTLTDTRDGNTYRVRKLADGKCWMIDNLRLGDSKLTNRTLTSTNTDLNGITSYTLPNSSKSGFTSNTAHNLYVVEADSGSELKVYGGYYNWNVATAGTGTSLTSSGVNASSSICPKGWRLPTGGSSSGELKVLNDKLGGATNSDTHLINSSGPAFLRAGQITNGTAYVQGSMGVYWSSTSYYINNSISAWTMRFNSTTVTQINYTAYVGLTVRCLAK